MTYIQKIGQEITTAVRDFVTRSLQSRDARIADLERRITETETIQKSMRYRGVWQSAEDYQKGNFVTFDGSLWAATIDSPGKPGQSGWQLAAKKGADAR